MIKATRNNKGNNFACKESRIYFGVRKGVRYGDTFFVEGNASDFVLKLMISKLEGKQGTN